MDVKLPDGTVIQNIPEGTTKAQLIQKLQANGHDVSGLVDTPKPDKNIVQQTLSSLNAAIPGGGGIKSVGQGAGNVLAGAVRGAGSIGATILYPVDAAARAMGVQNDFIGRTDRRAGMDGALQTMGAETDSLMYQGGKLAGEVAGTAGAGGVLANGAKAVPVLAKYAPTIQSGGFNLADAATKSNLVNALLRMGGGAAQGGTQAAMVNPNDAGTGALVGGVIPGLTQASGYAGNAIKSGLDIASRKLMQSALKPTIEQLRSGKAATAVQTLLDEGINATQGGVTKLRGMIDDINTQVADRINTSGATVSKQKVLEALKNTRKNFSSQVSPTGDLNAIAGVADDFAAHPMIAGDSIPVQLAQKLKQGTYKTLSKKYGQVGSAETEAQKALARGLKEEISNAVPEVAGLNARESKLITTLSVSERRALMDANKNPMGLAILASSPAAWAAFMADKSALFKSLAARSVNGVNTAANAATPKALPNLMQQHGLLGAPSVIATNP